MTWPGTGACAAALPGPSCLWVRPTLSAVVGLICDGLLSEQIGELPFGIAQERFAGAVVMSDASVRRAMKFAFRHLKVVLEPSGAASLAAVLEGGLDLKCKTVALVASGGNVDAETFAAASA